VARRKALAPTPLPDNVEAALARIDATPGQSATILREVFQRLHAKGKDVLLRVDWGAGAAVRAVPVQLDDGELLDDSPIPDDEEDADV
jgi:hypothetical protein